MQIVPSRRKSLARCLSDYRNVVQNTNGSCPTFRYDRSQWNSATRSEALTRYKDLRITHPFLCSEVNTLRRRSVLQNCIDALRPKSGLQANPKECVMSSDDPVVRSPYSHFRILGSFWILYAVIRLIMVV